MTDKEWHEREYDPEFIFYNYILDKHYAIVHVNSLTTLSIRADQPACREFLTNRISKQEYYEIMKRGKLQKRYNFHYLLELKAVAFPASAGAFINWEDFRDDKVNNPNI